ncbi:unnamed protein product [Phytophthora fragariaefolia]|uniref:Unnamed protein product n=1 Tax=Phytophthora fragariaefolia TaxID=1490495 RepID=A0A9W6XD29_9STRA|nr:unnamed protein product [Phytophthora fragariaefolia]
MAAVTASTTPTTTSTNGPEPKPLMVSVKTFEGKEGKSLLLLTRELEMAMDSTLLKTEQQRRAALSNTGRVCKPGLLAVQATVKGFEKPWTILTDSGASGNYARRSTMAGSQLYAEALRARNHDIVTVRLAMSTRVTVPKEPVDLGVKFLDFDSVERCLALYLDAIYDLMLGMAWLERHEP